MNSKNSKQNEIKYLKQTILEMREWDCQNVADMLCDELEKLQGDIEL